MSEVAVKRSKWAEFLNITPNASAPTWARIGKGVSENEISYNANVVSETFIHEDSAENSVDSFAPQIPVTQYAYKGNPVFDYVDGLRKSRALGTDCETQLLLVNMYDPTEEGGSVFSAELQNVAIQIDTFGGAGGERNQIGYNILFNGDPTVGTATITSGTPTFSAGTVQTTSSTKSSKAVAD